MENLLPSFGNRLEESQQRTRPNQQWDPMRSTYEAGAMLPARLRCLTKMTEQETAIENPLEMKVSSVEPLTQVVSSQGAAEFIAPLPSVIGAGGRGEAPQTRISRTLPGNEGRRSTKAIEAPKTVIGMEKDAPLLTFVNDAAADFFETEEERAMAADYMTSSTQEMLGHDPVDIFLKGEKGLAPMVHRTLAPGTHMVRTVAGGAMPASAVAAGAGGGGAAGTLQAERGIMVLVTTRARLGPAANDGASQAISEHGSRGLGGDVSGSGGQQLQLDGYYPSGDNGSRHSRSLERVKERFDFKVERPLGLELEYDAVNHVVIVHRCRPEGQGAALGVRPGSIVLRVAGRPARTLEDFEESVVRLRQQGDPTAIIPLVVLAPGEDNNPLDVGIDGQQQQQQQQQQQRQFESGGAKEHERREGGYGDDKASMSSDSADLEAHGHGLTRLFRQQTLAAEQKGGGNGNGSGNGNGNDNGGGGGDDDDDESLGLLGVEDLALASEAKDGGALGGGGRGGSRGAKRRGGGGGGGGDDDDADGEGGKGDGGGRDAWAFATGGGFEVEDDGDGGMLVAARAEAKDNHNNNNNPDNYELGLPVPTVLHPLPDLPFAMGVSVDDRVPVTLYFVNQSPHLHLEVGWVDYEGRLVPRKLLGPGDAHLERSWASHPWLLSAIQPPAFDPEVHASPAAADALPAAADDRDMTLLLRVGEAAAKPGQSRGYSLLWQPRDRAISFMPQARSDPGKLRPELDPANATDSATRVRNTRASLVQQLRELRADPSGGANGGKPPTLTVLMMGNQHGVSVLQPY